MNDSRSKGSSEPLAFSTPGASQAAHCLKHAYNLTENFLSKHWPACWKEWCDQLSLDAERARSVEETTLWLNSRATLETAHDVGKLAFYRQIEEGFTALLSASGHVPLATEDDGNAAPERLTQTALIRRAERRLAEPLWQLQHRLALLSGGQVNDESNPLSPAYWCDALSRVFRMIELPMAARERGYQAFENGVLVALGDLYDAINRYFIGQGVLPNLGFSAEDCASSAESPQGVGVLWEARYQKGLYHSIRLLRQHSRETSSHGVSSGGESAARLAAGLLPLQRERQKHFDALSAADAGELPRVYLTVESLLWSEDALETVYLTGQVFDYLQHDLTLPLSVRVTLTYLYLPFLRLALLDETFFREPGHPARQLLNELVDVGARWVDEREHPLNDSQQGLRQVTSRLLKVFDEQAQCFSDLLTDFRSHTGNFTHRQERVERRALEKIRGQERWRDARQRVNSEVRRYTGKPGLPSAILLLLSQPWSEYMAFVLMRHGVGSAEWLACRHTTDQLLWTLEPKRSDAERESQEAVEEELLKAIQAGLNAIGYDPSKSRKLLEAVRNLQVTARAGRQPEAAPVAMRAKLAALVTGNDDQAQALPKASNEEEQAWLDRLQRLEPGTWMQHQSGRRKKVVWYDRRTLHFMLVDQLGNKVVMRAGLSLAADLAAGRLHILEGSARPFFGRALEHIYRQLSGAAGVHSGANEPQR